MSISDAAAFLATEWRVFPVCLEREGGEWRKQPLVKWREEASRDPDTVRQMFAHPAANAIGVPMGADTGLFLLDLDTKRGAPGLEWLAANEHRLPATRTHRTPSGGLHLYFKWPHGLLIRNSAGKIAPGVDIRGEGGFAMVPPSPGYVITNEAMPADAPQWLLDLIIPPAPPKAAITYTAPAARIPDRYAEAALDGECRAVASAAEGGRNHRLNVAAVKLGSLVAAGALSEATVRAELRRAALHAGLDPRETDLTIQSGLTFGLTQPRAVPERQVQTIRIEIVPPEPPPYEAPPPHWEAEPEVEPHQETKAGASKRAALWTDLAAWNPADIPRRPWAVPGYLMRGSVSVLSGQGAGGKSSLVVAWTISLADGEAIGGFKPDRPMVVVNYNTEDDRDEQQRRYSAALAAAKKDGAAIMPRIVRCGPHDVGTLFERNFDTGRIAPTAAMEELKAICADSGADVLVCDPLAELHNAEENDNTAMRAVIAAFRTLAKDLGIAVLILHHDRKGNNAPGDMDRVRGASAISGAVRVMLTLTTMTAEEADKLGVQPEDRRRHFRIDGAKSNYAPTQDAEWWRLEAREIGNGEQIAACLPWEPPTPFGGLSMQDVTNILQRIHQGTHGGHAFAATKQAGADWAGRIITENYGKTDKQAATILAAWEQNGVLIVDELDSPRRGHKRKAYAVDLDAFSEMRQQMKGAQTDE